MSITVIYHTIYVSWPCCN